MESGERLFSRSEWVADEELSGGDEKILTCPVLHEAFERILTDFKPRYSVALMALCTSVRPYSATPTWKALLATAEGLADPIVTSNGGIVPIEYESEWPFLSYDAPGSHEHDGLYIDVLAARLVRFVETFQYRRLVFVYLPGKRNRGAVATVAAETGVQCSIVPGPSLWASLARKVPAKSGKRWTERFKNDGFLWAPLAHPEIQAEARALLEGSR